MVVVVVVVAAGAAAASLVVAGGGGCCCCRCGGGCCCGCRCAVAVVVVVSPSWFRTLLRLHALPCSGRGRRIKPRFVGGIALCADTPRCLLRA